MAAGPFRLVDRTRCFAAYLWADPDVEDVPEFLDRHGIDVVPGKVFGLPRGGRVNLADPARIAVLVDALGAV